MPYSTHAHANAIASRYAIQIVGSGMPNMIASGTSKPLQWETEYVAVSLSKEEEKEKVSSTIKALILAL